MTTLTITTNATASPPWSLALSTAAATNSPDVPRTMPAFIRADESYYWSFPWQEDVREAMAALAAGDYEEFDSDDPNDVVRWMLTIEDDDEA
jgi:hypothetical protein